LTESEITNKILYFCCTWISNTTNA